MITPFYSRLRMEWLDNPKNMTNLETMTEFELAGNVSIWLPEPFDMQLDVNQKLYGALAFYAVKNNKPNIINFALELLKGRLENQAASREYADKYHLGTAQNAVLNELANALTVLVLREISLISKNKKRSKGE